MAGRYNHTARVSLVLWLSLFAVASVPRVVWAQQAAVETPRLTVEEQEVFLKNAKILRTKGVNKGVTGTLKATLSDGRVEHDASIQSIDESMTEFKSNRGTEFNFRDSWRYNVAAYRLDRLISLNMIPPSVERNFQSKPSSFTWWVDDVLMDEGQRLKSKKAAPDATLWNQQMWLVRMFDQLIYNVDRNLGNLVIDTRWTIWMIDHSRAFRLHDQLKTPGNLSKIDRQVFDRLKALDEPTLKKTMADYLTPSEIRGLLKRRDLIVQWAEKLGPTAFFDRSGS